MLKYSLGLFFTTALMTILVEGITQHNVFTEHYGIFEEETIMVFFQRFPRSSNLAYQPLVHLEAHQKKVLPK